MIIGLGTFVYFYNYYARLIDEKLAQGPFALTSAIYATPQKIALGENATVEDIVGQLVRSGLHHQPHQYARWYNERADGVEIYPGGDSYFSSGDAGVIKIAEGRVQRIILLSDNTERTEYSLEPELVTNLFDKKREKRRLVRFKDLPKDLVNAIVAVEDKHFFEHSGFDPLRIVKSAWDDLRTPVPHLRLFHAHHAARPRPLAHPGKTLKRKAAESLITIHPRKQAHQRGDLRVLRQLRPPRPPRQLQYPWRRRSRPGLFRQGRQEPHPRGKRHPGRSHPAAQRPQSLPLARPGPRPPQRRSFSHARQQVCRRAPLRRSQAAELVLSRTTNDSTDAPYFVDLVNDTLQDKFQDHDFQDKAYRIYTSIDMELQRDATEAVRLGMQEVDKIIAPLHKRKDGTVPEAQVSLVALDAETGELRALVGGRNYGQSQLNRGLAKRQPGSIFKPFVYAAALNTGLYDAKEVFTTVSVLTDEPTTFYYDGKVYEPNNYHSAFYGDVTLRSALMKSLNIPTVKLAEQVGYGRVVELARKAGLSEQRATPAVALGAYEATPIDMAGSYTVFPNNGTYKKPGWINLIRDDRGSVIFRAKPETRQVLDARVNYLMVNLLEDVIRGGTGAGARARGFWPPAGGKTGTSRDGWFAGFTSKLICVVWVGFDDNADLKLEGAKTALPVWTEFMKRAHQHRRYRNVRSFSAPDGIVSAEVDTKSGKLGVQGDENVRGEVFLAGTEPVEVGGGKTQIAGWDAPKDPSEAAKADAQSSSEIEAATRRQRAERRSESGAARPPAGVRTERVSTPPSGAPAEQPKSKKSFWDKVGGIFK